MDPFAIKPLPRAALEQKSARELEPARGAAFTACFDLGADARQRRTAAEHAEAIERAEGVLGMADASAEEVQVVRFEAAGEREGQVLVIAHVVSARLSELCAEAEELRQRRAHGALPPTHARVEVVLHAQDTCSGRASIQVEDGALGPMLLELRLERGRIDVHATVCSAQAAEALTSDQALLERALRMQGLALGSLSVQVQRRQAKKKRSETRKSASHERAADARCEQARDNERRADERPADKDG